MNRTINVRLRAVIHGMDKMHFCKHTTTSFSVLFRVCDTLWHVYVNDTDVVHVYNIDKTGNLNVVTNGFHFFEGLARIIARQSKAYFDNAMVAQRYGSLLYFMISGTPSRL